VLALVCARAAKQSWQGGESNRQKGTTVKEALDKAGFKVVTSESAAREAADRGGAGSVIGLVVASEPQYAEYEGDE
jgi:hypothetical protein